MTVLEKLAQIQAELKAPKNQHNKYGNYNYRNIEDIYEALKPLLKKTKASVVMSDSVEECAGKVYIKACAKLVCTETGESISNFALAREDDDPRGSMSNAQASGSASSYARKYALGGLFLLDDTKDDDTNESHEEKTARAKEKSDEKKLEDVGNSIIGEAKVKTLWVKCKTDSVNVKELCKCYKVKNFNELTEKQFANIAQNWDKVIEKCKFVEE